MRHAQGWPPEDAAFAQVDQWSNEPVAYLRHRRDKKRHFLMAQKATYGEAQSSRVFGHSGAPEERLRTYRRSVAELVIAVILAGLCCGLSALGLWAMWRQYYD